MYQATIPFRRRRGRSGRTGTEYSGLQRVGLQKARRIGRLVDSMTALDAKFFTTAHGRPTPSKAMGLLLGARNSHWLSSPGAHAVHSIRTATRCRSQRLGLCLYSIREFYGHCRLRASSRLRSLTDRSFTLHPRLAAALGSLPMPLLHSVNASASLLHSAPCPCMQYRQPGTSVSSSRPIRRPRTIVALVGRLVGRSGSRDSIEIMEKAFWTRVYHPTHKNLADQGHPLPPVDQYGGRHG